MKTYYCPLCGEEITAKFRGSKRNFSFHSTCIKCGWMLRACKTRTELDEAVEAFIEKLNQFKKSK